MRLPDSALIYRPRQTLVMTWAAVLILGGILLASPAKAQTLAPRSSLVDPSARIPALSEGRSAVVFIKSAANSPSTASAVGGATVSVFIDGTYHASLPMASWAYAEVCPGPHFLKAVQDNAILAVTESKPSGQPFDLALGSTSYFQLSEDGQGAPRLDPVEAGAANTVIDQLPKAVHTISRLQSRNCVLPVEASPQPLPTQAQTVSTNYTLQASAFFDFDNSQMSSKQGHGRDELDEIIRKVGTSYMTVKNIEVLGYADPTGSAAYNLKLSRERAETVAKYLTNAGLGSVAISAKGMGATNLVVPDCATWLKTPQQIHACNEPNRRVELVVHGQPKNQ